MRKNEFYKNNHGKHSHIYCIKDRLPQEKISVSNSKNIYDIQAFNINIGDIKNPYSPSKDAYIIVFEQNGNNDYRQIGKIRTNDEGYASIFYNGDKNLYYKASNRQCKYIYKGFLVTGMYTTQEEVDNALPHSNLSPIFMPKLGGVKFLDLNADGKIDFNDKKGAKFIKLDKNTEINKIYLVDYKYGN